MPSPPPIASLFRIHPESGEILATDNPTVPRAIVLDSSKTLIATTLNVGLYSSYFEGLELMSESWEDANFNSIRNLNRPLGFENGGNPYGQYYLNGGSFTMTPVFTTVLCNTASFNSVYLVSPYPSNSTLGWVVTVGDVAGQAATRNITVYGDGWQLEDPNTPGTFSSFIQIHTNWQVVTWIFDVHNNRYKVLSSNASGGGGGVAVQKNGSTIVATATTENFTGPGVAVTNVGGVATINIPGYVAGYVLVGNANPSTATLDNNHLQAIVDSSVSTTTVNAPDIGNYIQQTFRVTDDTGFAATNPITVASTNTLEDPNSAGTFSASVQIQVNGQSVDWEWTGSHYKIV